MPERDNTHPSHKVKKVSSLLTYSKKYLSSRGNKVISFICRAIAFIPCPYSFKFYHLPSIHKMKCVLLRYII
jgi:hypothetical protein